MLQADFEASLHLVSMSKKHLRESLLFFRVIENLSPTSHARDLSVSSLWCLVGRSPVGRAAHLKRVIGFAIILTGLVTGVRVRRKKQVLAIFQEQHPSHRHI